MRALTMKARTVLAASVCLLVLVLLLPVAANADVTVKHIRVTVSNVTGPAVTGLYCDTDVALPCVNGIRLWNLTASGITLTPGKTLVLAQTGTTVSSGFSVPGAPNAGNFDSSERINPVSPFEAVCGPSSQCRVRISLDTGAGLVQIYDDGGAGNALSNFNQDNGLLSHCEGQPYTTVYTQPGYTVGTGYADNVHNLNGTPLPSCNFFPSPFFATANNTFLGGGTGTQNICSTNCFDSGAIVITGLLAGCTLTQGFWKNHGPDPSGNNENEWPVNHLLLGTHDYTANQLQSILDTPPQGNGLITLAHQLIAAKLNIANGASNTIQATITAADNLIDGLIIPPVGSGELKPSQVSALVTALTNFNEGITGPGHCSDTDTE